MSNELLALRQAIDEIDEQLVALLNKRAELHLRVKEAKKGLNLSTYVPAREREVMERVLVLAEGGNFPRYGLERIFGTILSVSRAMQGEQTVCYLGPKGSQAFDAAMCKFGSNAMLQPETAIDDVFEKVEIGQAQYGVIPLETSIGGLVSGTLSAFLHYRLNIISEIFQTSSLVLLSPDVGLERIKRVYGDSNAVVMAERWMSINLPEVTIEVVANSDVAARRALETEHAGMLGSDHVTDSYPLAVIARGVEEEGASFRYVVIGSSGVPPSGRDKTSLLCEVPDKPGALLEVLAPFARANITLTKIDSRVLARNQIVSSHLPNNSGYYFFFVDFQGHREEPVVKSVLEDLSRVCAGIHVLGSYPRESN